MEPGFIYGEIITLENGNTRQELTCVETGAIIVEIRTPTGLIRHNKATEELGRLIAETLKNLKIFL